MNISVLFVVLRLLWCLTEIVVGAIAMLMIIFKMNYLKISAPTAEDAFTTGMHVVIYSITVSSVEIA